MRIVYFILPLLLAACTLAQTNIDSNTNSHVDWPLYGLNYQGQRHSSLTQINRNNVSKLVPAWQLNTGVKSTFQATPIVVGGVMYVSLPF